MDTKDEKRGEGGERGVAAAVGPLAFPTFLSALFDEINVEILRATALDFLSVKEIAEACELPMRACYRRIHALLKEGLLCPKQDDPEGRGRPSNRYRSNIGNVYVKISGGDYRVQLVWPTDKLDLAVLSQD